MLSKKLFVSMDYMSTIFWVLINYIQWNMMFEIVITCKLNVKVGMKVNKIEFPIFIKKISLNNLVSD